MRSYASTVQLLVFKIPHLKARPQAGLIFLLFFSAIEAVKLFTFYRLR
jgi:hypothetical protein